MVVSIGAAQQRSVVLVIRVITMDMVLAGKPWPVAVRQAMAARLAIPNRLCGLHLK